MKSPEQIRDMEFQKSTMGGYKQSDVELFLEEVASQIEILTRQKSDLEKKLQDVSRKAPEAALSAAGIQNVLLNAQRVADEVVENANTTAEGIISDSKMKLAEAEVKSREIITEAEKKAVLLGDTAEKEATKIIAAATEEARLIVAEAKESIELEQKLYDRMKIEISDFRKKASQQCNSLVELIDQLPGEIPFNLERSKIVLSVDFSNPEKLLKDAVEERIAKENKNKTETEVKAVVDAETAPTILASKPVADKVEKAVENDVPIIIEANDEPTEAEANPESITPVIIDTEFAEEEQLAFDTNVTGFSLSEPETEDVEETVPFTVTALEPEPKKSRISFDDYYDGDDEEDDDEPRLFFRRKKK